MKRAFFTLVVIDIVLMLFVYFFQGELWLINSQVAFISSTLIMLSSIYSYRNMVYKAVVAGAAMDDGRDTLDKVEDPYDLYDEVKVTTEEKTLVDVVKEERENLKKGRRSIWETTKDAKASLSFYRLGAYGVLVLGFFYLNTNKLLELIPYLIFLSLPPMIIVLVLMLKNQKK